MIFLPYNLLKKYMGDKELPSTKYSQTNITVNHHHHYYYSNEEEVGCHTDESWSDDTINLVSGIIYSVITVAVPIIVAAVSSRPKKDVKERRKPASKRKQLKNN